MGATLHVSSPRTEPFEVSIGNTATVGRTRENTICLSGSPLVSRQHAIIRCHDVFQYQIIDLGSRNGTFVNDRRVVLPVTLPDGASIRIADFTLSFSEDAEEESGDDLQLTIVEGTPESVVARPVALLVCDIRAFSTMSEKTKSSELAQVLGAWFRETGNIVVKSGGTIDKFIGDAVLAYWGGSGVARTDCAAALSAARELLELASARKWPTGEAFRTATAVHYGPVTRSNVGVAAGRDATIIGDAVNTVFRLESVAKELGQRFVISGEFAAHMTDRSEFQDFGERALKGKQQAVRVFGVE